MARWGGFMILVAAVAMMALGCTQQPSATAAVVADKTYTVTPGSVTVKAGIITGEFTDMKVTERVEEGSDRVVSPAKLTGTLSLKNTSVNETVRLVAGRIHYIDAHGQLIKLEDARGEPTLTFTTYGDERLDPGQAATRSLDVEFPTDALQAKKLKDVRLELVYIPSPYREEAVNFPVSISQAR
jgi:hypothetical protein